MEAWTEKFDKYLEAKKNWAVLDEDDDILGIKADAPEWARTILKEELVAMNSDKPRVK